jgi:MFS family permease
MDARPPTSDTVPTAFPLWPLLATMAMQTLATMAAYSIPALAPMVARDIGVDGALIGMFVSVVYGVGIISSLLAAGIIARYGAVRTAQFVLLCALGLVVVCAQGTATSVALGALILGVAYGVTAPVSTHLLVPRTPPSILNMVLSTRQIGVPLAGVLAATLMPPIALAIGWKAGLLLQAIPIIALILLLEIPRRAWDGTPAPVAASAKSVLVRSFGLLRGDSAMQRLTLASFVYSGAQLAFVAFMTVHVTSRTGLGLVTAGWALATYQLAGRDLSADIRLDRGQIHSGADHARRPGLHHGCSGTPRGQLRAGLASVGDHGCRGCRGGHGERLHRPCLCRVCAPRWCPADGGDWPRLGRHVLRRARHAVARQRRDHGDR